MSDEATPNATITATATDPREPGANLTNFTKIDR